MSAIETTFAALAAFHGSPWPPAQAISPLYSPVEDFAAQCDIDFGGISEFGADISTKSSLLGRPAGEIA
ncbi:MAG: hypothetical protein ACYDA6_00420, partial [Solirubrobacteraceae bacterium]